MTALLLLLSAGCAGASPVAPDPVLPGDARGAEPIASSRAYPVRLHRPERVGDASRVTIEGRNRSRQSGVADGRTLFERVEAWEARLVATRTVLAVDARGQEVAASYRVEDARLTREGRAAPWLSPGAEIVVRRVGSTVVVDGVAATAEQREVLDILLPVRVPRVTEDDLLGSDRPREVGASWPIDAGAAARRFESEHVVLDPAGLDGRVTLLGVERVDGVECLRLGARFTAVGMTVPAAPGADVRSGQLVFDVEALYPTDGASPPRAESRAMLGEVIIDAPAPNGPPLHVEMRLDISRAARFEPLPRAP